MTRLLNRWHDAERLAMLWLYAFITVTIIIEVLRRFVFDFSSIWGEEAARYAFIYLVWIGAAVGVRNRSHISFSILVDILPARGAATFSIFGNLAVMTFAGFALYWSIEPVLTSLKYGSVSEGLQLSRAWFLVAVPLGFTLVMLRAIEATIADIRAFASNRRPPSGEKLFD
ncbi:MULTISPECIES: TRAP transporter small permease [Roseovarius]|uniref:TRAP transporter small permease n=1 Tax=Roseovarius TaxID=74030 RepID=UPI00032329B2|nr:TRAP transporter small permease [Roseovarius nubinhibens]|tara:strand:+ start:1685 stop:2197 length:513 start_codon:yes stop_codon:yes gene_type:complete